MISLKKTAAFSVIWSLVLSTFIPATPAFASATYVGSAAPLELPAANAGQKYSYQFEAEGGLPPLTWKIIRGDVPQELTLTSSGKFHGTLTQSQPKTYQFTVEVKDSSATPQTFAEDFSLNVLPAPLRIISGHTASAPGLRISVAPKPVSTASFSVPMNAASENTGLTVPPATTKTAGNTPTDDPPATTDKRKVFGRLRPASLDEILKTITSDEDLTRDKAIKKQLCRVGDEDFCSSDEEACQAGFANRCKNGAEPGRKTNKLATIQLLQLLLSLQGPSKESVENKTYQFSADSLKIESSNNSKLKKKSERFDPKRLSKLIDFLSNYTATIIVNAEDKDGKLVATTTTNTNGEFSLALADCVADGYYIISSKADNFYTKEKIFVAGENLHVSLGIEDRPVNLLTRAVVGYQQAGAASTAFEQNYFFDLFISQSLPFKQKIDPDFGEPLRTWGAIRAISAPQSGNVTIGDLSTNFVTKVKELKANEAARVFDYLGGIEYRLPFFKNRSLLPSFDRQTKQKFTLSMIASGGFVTPTNPNETDPKAYKITDAYRTRFKNEVKGSELLSGDELDGKDYVAFLPTDRDRFFRQFYAGFRMQTFFFNRHDVPIQRFPVQLDLQYGFNEYVTSGRLRGGVIRLDGYFPLPYDNLNFINLFGTAIFRPVRSNIQKTLILEEADGKFFDDKTAVLPVSQFNRDYYRVGVGIDFISFVGKLLRN